METKKFKIKGMHCASCEVLIERKIKSLKGVHSVNVNHSDGTAEVTYERELDDSAVDAAIKADGYSIISSRSSSREDSVKDYSKEYAEQKDTSYDYTVIGAMFVVVIGLYLFLGQFDLLPKDFGITNNMSYFFIFGLGLVAAMSTCLAVTGGLLLGIATRHAEKNPGLTGAQKFKPHLYFNAGRIVSYTLLGGLVGAIGSIIVLSPRVSGWLTVFVSIVMVALGMQMLGFTWLNKITPKMPKFIAHRIYDSTGSEKKSAPFLFGASTFFLPCGFTQALQLYVLSTGSFAVGALTMLAFSLGTLPSLMTIGAVSSYSKGEFKKHFVKFAGVLVIFMGVLSIGSGLTLTGANLLPAGGADSGDLVPIVDGKQIVEMKVFGLDYYPSEFTLRKGVPVEWRVDGTEAIGCAQILSIPNMGITTRLQRGINVIEFTPQRAGNLRFTCSMGMAGPGTFRIIE